MDGRAVALVEDDEACARACIDELRSSSWEATWLPSAHAALAACRAGALAPYVLMDLRLAGECAFTAIQSIRAVCPSTVVIAFTAHATDDYVFRALRAGAVGYVLKHAAEGAIAEVLEQAYAGGAPMTPGIARRVIESLHVAPPVADPRQPLSDREREVLSLLARGFSYAECAASLGLALDTVRSHVRRAYEKLHASSKAEAVAVAMREGWLD